MASDIITLFDIPTKEPRRCWSPNLWKIRLVLNFKGLDYKTEWIEYPDIKPRLEKHLSPNETQPAYTCPTIQLPDGTYIMDSLVIARALEKAHPTPPLHLESPLIPRVDAILDKLKPHFFAIFANQTPYRLLPPRSVAFWEATRTARAGMPLAQLEALRGGETGWSGAEPALREMSALFRRGEEEGGSGDSDSSGPFLMGHAPGYADFVWASYLIFFRTLGEDMFEELLKRSGDREVHLRLLEGLAGWSRRDDH